MPTPWTDSLFLCPQDGSSGSHEVAMPCTSRRRAGVCPLTPSVARRTGVIRTPRFPGDHVRQQWGQAGRHSGSQPRAAGCAWVRAGSGPWPARATLTCPGTPPPPLQSPARAHPPPVSLPSGCLAHPAHPWWTRVALCHSLAGRWVIGICRGQVDRRASHRRPLLASGVGLGLGSRLLPGPPPGGGQQAQPGPWHPGALHFALRGGRPPWGPALPS